MADPNDAARVRKGVEELRRKRAEQDAAEAVADDDQGDEPDEFDRGRYSRSRSKLSAPRALRGNGTGFILGLIAWAWVGRPLIMGGPAQVKKTLKAKFTNKSLDGKWLP